MVGKPASTIIAIIILAVSLATAIACGGDDKPRELTCAEAARYLRFAQRDMSDLVHSDYYSSYEFDAIYARIQHYRAILDECDRGERW